MSRLFNTTVYAAMNDSSVTSGNADGWVVLERDPVIEPANVNGGRRPAEPTRKNAKRSGKSRRGSRRP